MHDYKLKYKLELGVGHFSSEEIHQERAGGCDALMLVAIVYPKGKLTSSKPGSLTVSSYDGRHEGKTIPIRDQFSIWLLMTTHFVNNAFLDPLRRTFAMSTFKQFRKLVSDPDDSQESDKDESDSRIISN